MARRVYCDAASAGSGLRRRPSFLHTLILQNSRRFDSHVEVPLELLHAPVIGRTDRDQAQKARCCQVGLQVTLTALALGSRKQMVEKELRQQDVSLGSSSCSCLLPDGD